MSKVDWSNIPLDESFVGETRIGQFPSEDWYSGPLEYKTDKDNSFYTDDLTCSFAIKPKPCLFPCSDTFSCSNTFLPPSNSTRKKDTIDEIIKDSKTGKSFNINSTSNRQHDTIDDIINGSSVKKSIVNPFEGDLIEVKKFIH